MARSPGCLSGPLCLVAICLATATSAAEPATRPDRPGSVQLRGLTVRLCCGTADRTILPAAPSPGLTLILDCDKAKAVLARNAAMESVEGSQAAVQVDHADFRSLPVCDNLANCVQVDDLAAAARAGLTLRELVRILAPGSMGVLRAVTDPAATAKELAGLGIRADVVPPDGAGREISFVKPRPAGFDEWTHARHGADGNLVSQDGLSGAPTSLQWLAGPVQSSGEAILVSNGRIFYMAEYASLPGFIGPTVTDAPAASLASPIQPGRPGMMLIARDAFNGLPLWRRPIRSMTFCAATDGRRVYVVSGEEVLAISAETGQVDAVFGKAVVHSMTRLLLKEPWLVVAGPKKIECFDTRTGRLAWTQERLAFAENLRPPAQSGSNVLIGEDGLVYDFGDVARQVVARELATGEQVWSRNIGEWAKGKDRLLFAKGGIVVFDADSGDAKHVNVLSPKDGKLAWSFRYSYPEKAKVRWYVLLADGLVWVQKWLANGEDKPVQWEGIDPLTGKRKRLLDVPRSILWGCHPEMATERFLLFNRPADMVSWADGTVLRFRAARASCLVGSVIANNMYYAAPNFCYCFQGMVRGFSGLAVPPSAEAFAAAEKTERLEKGPAYESGVGEQAAPMAHDWPVYRRDAARSACSPVQLKGELRQAWSERLVDRPADSAGSLLPDERLANPLGGDLLTAPVAVGDRTYVGLVDRGAVVALDGDGKRLWTFRTGGRVDTPPTIHAGLCLVGSHDGYVYCLKAADGQLVWRYRVAPADRRMLAFGQVESAWPVVGGLIVKDGLAILAAGRSPEAFGAVRVVALDPATGRLAWEYVLPAGDRTLASADVVVADDRAVAIGGSPTFRLDGKTGRRLPPENMAALRSSARGAEFSRTADTTGNLLDRGWHSANGGNLRRFHAQHAFGTVGYLIAFDGRQVVACRTSGGGPATTWVVSARDYATSQPEPGAPVPTTEPEWNWSVPLPRKMQPDALLVAGEHVLVAAVSDRQARSEGLILVLSMKDGSTVSQFKLPGGAAADGMAVADGRLIVTTWRGEVLCLKPGG